MPILMAFAVLEGFFLQVYPWCLLFKGLLLADPAPDCTRLILMVFAVLEGFFSQVQLRTVPACVCTHDALKGVSA